MYFYYRGDLELVFEVVHPFLAIKFRFSKKATKFEKKSHLEMLLTIEFSAATAHIDIINLEALPITY